MKHKLLLIASLSIGICAQAQFDNSNAPAIGDQTGYFGLDSLAPAYDGTTGTGVTWDYSATLGIANETRELSILDASTEDSNGDFPSSTHAQKLEGLLTTFYTGDASGRISQGIIFQDPTLGSVVATFENDDEQLYTYPFGLGSTIDDTYSGTYSTVYLGMPVSGALNGVFNATVDGKGTLKLANNEYTDVLRYKLIDTVNITNVPVLNNLVMIRVQYEYYDHSTDNLPIFIHTTVVLRQPGEPALSKQYSVLSIEQPSEFLELAENEMDATSVYPNPALEELNIQLPSSVQSADIQITDALGRRAMNTVVTAGMKTIDVSLLNKGVYFVNISNGVQSSIQRVIIK